MAAESDLAHIGRLKEEEEKALQETLNNVQHWQKFDQDYSALKERLQTLPDKVSHQVMVPLGKLAFMPGQLIHTNEVMVLLGDNWFAQRSAKQACEIIDRRKAHIQTMVDDLQKQRYLLESRLGFVSEMKGTVEGKGDVVEIREEYDAEKEANWREERKARRKDAASSKTKPSSPSSSSSSKAKQRTDTEDETNDKKKVNQMTDDELLWARLDELERQEEELDELAMLSDEESDSDEVGLQQRLGTTTLEQAEHAASLPHHLTNQKHVHWDDQNGTSPLDVGLQLKQGGEADDEDEDDDDDDDDDNHKASNVIRFSHSDVPSPRRDHHGNQDGKDLSPRTPGDIYEQYQSMSGGGGDGAASEGHIKSILKHTTSYPDSEPVKVAKTEKRQPLPAPVSAFSGSIVEHSPTEVTKPVAPSPQGQGSQRVSKFKAARQGRR